MSQDLAFELEEAPSADDPEEFAREVRSGLRAQPKELPCRFLYDAEGSRIFEEICKQPEYYPTEAEREILLERGEEILDFFQGPIELVELGSGNSEKTHHLLEVACELSDSVRYVPVDICREIIESAAASLLEEMPELRIHGLAAEYAEALRLLREGELGQEAGPRAILWLGSNLGNFTREESAAWVARIGACLRPGDRFVLGADLRKDRDVLERAYDDPAGVTASFSKNLLARINRELDGEFDLEAFEHVAEYDPAAGTVRIYLESQREQEVRIGALGETVHLSRGERIHTEDSNKYSLEEVRLLAARAGLAIERSWYDARGYYSLHRLRLASDR